MLEKGDYNISINSDSHTVIGSKKITVDDTITYDSDSNTHNGDQTVATNQFDDAAGDVTYLSRAGHFANYKEATAAPTNFEMSDKAKETFYNNTNYDPSQFNDDSDEMPTTGTKNGLRLADMYGKDYDDADWEKLLDELTFDDMDNLIANGGYGTPAVSSVGKIQLTDADGPASLNNNFTGVGSIGFPASTAFACTWNKDLAKQFGRDDRRYGSRHACCWLVRSGYEHPPQRILRPYFRVLLRGFPALRRHGIQRDRRRQGEGRVLLHEALRAERSGNQAY